MNSSDSGTDRDWRFIHFGLIVTGKTEEKCLPDLFRVMQATGACTFRVIRKIGQRSPRSEKRQLQMVGRGKMIPDKDETEIGLPARFYLSSDDRFVILIDDLEADRSSYIQEIFDRYRRALDTILVPSQACRASVHFLVNMLEAYFFAHSDAVNSVLGTNLDDYEGDVETIRNPRAEIKRIYDEYKVVDDGCRIIRRLAVPHVLSRRDACSSLRTMFAWVHKAIGEPESEIGQFLTGRRSDVTKAQICALPW
jgi:hypothetical protein